MRKETQTILKKQIVRIMHRITVCLTVDNRLITILKLSIYICNYGLQGFLQTLLTLTTPSNPIQSELLSVRVTQCFLGHVLIDLRHMDWGGGTARDISAFMFRLLRSGRNAGRASFVVCPTHTLS